MLAKAVERQPGSLKTLLKAADSQDTVLMNADVQARTVEIEKTEQMLQEAQKAHDKTVSLKLLGLISCENLWVLIARHSALQERGANDQVIRSFD
jgi:hypothetical protein